MSDGLNNLEAAAFRRILYALAEEETDGDDPVMDAALELVDRVETLEDRVSELEQAVDPDPGSTAYNQLTRGQKVHRVRVKLLEQATDGKSPVMKYDDVRWLFDGKPSAGHAYDLMELAAEADGYVYETGGNGNGQKRIRVEPDAVNDERVLHAANKGVDATPA